MGMGYIKKSRASDAGADPSGRKSATGEKTSLSGERAGSVTGEASDKNKRYAAFLGAVAGDCGCERCCSYRDMASTLLNPSSDY